jgi:hypothetical protein
MLAHLGDGSYGGAQILKPETARLMHGIALQRHPLVPGMAYGFYHEDRNGHTIIGHGGDTLWFHSDLHLILDSGVGLFVSQNSAGKPGSGIRGPLFAGFMDRYFPARPLPPEPTLKSAKADGARVAGNYIVSRNSFTNILGISAFLDQATASVNDDGTLSVDTLKNFAGEPKKWREIAPFVWREVHGRGLLVATVKDGAVSEIASDALPQILTLQRAPWWQAQRIQLPLFAAMLAMLTLSVLFWPIKAVLRWRYGAPFEIAGSARSLYRLTRLVALCDLVLFGGVLGFFTYAGNGHLELMSSSNDRLLRLLQIVGLIGTIGVIFPLLHLRAALGNSTQPWWTKFTEALLAAACVLSVWFAFGAHFLVWSLKY